MKKFRNPIIVDKFIPDVEVHNFSDGKVYFFGSKDQEKNNWCSGEYEVFSSKDLSEIENHGRSLSINSLKDCKENYLYAPDCIELNGKYYLYFCCENGSEWVASGDTPCEFTDSVKMDGITGIDPTVFQDEDGQVYYFWGQFSLKGAKLSDDFKNVKKETIVDNILTQDKHFFHEGSSIRKRNGIYYIVFADVSRGEKTQYGGTPTCLGYATSKNIFGPYVYRGVIIDNIGCDPCSWNNHGSIECIDGQWYVFYHRSTCGHGYLRRCCCEKIFFDDNGLISEVKMTSSGANDYLDVTSLSMDASYFCFLRGTCYINSCTSPETLVNISDNDLACIRYLKLNNNNKLKINGCGIANLKIVAVDAEGTEIEIFDKIVNLDSDDELLDIQPISGV